MDTYLGLPIDVDARRESLRDRIDAKIFPDLHCCWRSNTNAPRTEIERNSEHVGNAVRVKLEA